MVRGDSVFIVEIAMFIVGVIVGSFLISSGVVWAIIRDPDWWYDFFDGVVEKKK